jgi:hypothetical protein
MKLRAMLALVLAAAVLAPIAGKAADDEEQQGRKACMYDALSLCAKFIPDRKQIANCLIANSEHVSPSCRILLVHAPATSQPSPER